MVEASNRDSLSVNHGSDYIVVDSQFIECVLTSVAMTVNLQRLAGSGWMSGI